MGLLLKRSTNNFLVLKLSHSVGRGQHNELVINEPDVSKSHASLHWSNGYWYLKDHSSNGTLINGELIIKESRRVKKGDVLRFGRNDENEFSLESDHKPSSYLSNKHKKEVRILLNDAAHFPSEEPVVSFFKINNQSSWYLDDGTYERLLKNGQEYLFCEEEWQFIENEPLEDTIVYQDINNSLTFNFLLSTDYENVRLILSNSETKFDLGQRVHNHLLLVLAREKAEDIAVGQNPALSGWVSMEYLVGILKKELLQPNINQYYINIMIHRIRKQFSDEFPFDANLSDLIERNNGKLRFRYDNVKIEIEGQVKIYTELDD